MLAHHKPGLACRPVNILTKEVVSAYSRRVKNIFQTHELEKPVEAGAIRTRNLDLTPA